MSTHETFANSLQVGSEVFEVTGNGSYFMPAKFTLGRVARLTATQIICESGNRYTRKTLRLYGSNGRIADPGNKEVQAQAARAHEITSRRDAYLRATAYFDRLRVAADQMSADDWEQIAARLKTALDLLKLRKQREAA